MTFFHSSTPNGNGLRLTGFPRFCELLDRDFKRFFLTNLLTLLGFLPLITGITFAILSSSILILIPACILGGAIAGPSLACMYDILFRSFRDAPGKFWEHYRRAWKQNWRQAIVPGILFGLLLGFYAFMFMLFWWAETFPSWGTLALYLLSLMVYTMFFSLYWPQLILFEQTQIRRLQNCLLFIIQFFWKTIGISFLQILYWAILILFLPWSLVLLPFIGIWFILFVANFLLYNTINEAFQIEQQITQSFPEQAALYEDDETWLKRKQKEQ